VGSVGAEKDKYAVCVRSELVRQRRGAVADAPVSAPGSEGEVLSAREGGGCRWACASDKSERSRFVAGSAHPMAGQCT
jgi:hypothetical protein